MINEHMISENFEKLFQAAKDVRDNAHVPYSKFKVGAAFLTEDNSIIAGCNVENAAYPQSQCAEASAIGNLVAKGFTKIKEVVVIGSGDLLCSPCGGCRQRLREFAALDVNIHMCNVNGHIKTSTLQSRAFAGVANGTFTFCLPGSPGACKDGWDLLISEQLDHRTKPCNLVELMPRLKE